MFRKQIAMLLICSLMLFYVPTKTKAAGEAVLDLSCKSAILIEQSTGQVLYEKDADIPLAMASVTKIMTMLLIMEAVDSGKIGMEDMVVGSERAKSMGGSTIFLDAGESLSVHDMLKGIAVASANDASVAMAEHIAGSEEGFVAMMNKRASELGMKNTMFKNTNGLDAEGHYSSARDIAIMSAELLKHPKIFDYTTIWMDSLRDGKFQLANTNKLIRFYKGANGLKTGSTNQALFCLSGAAKRDGMQLIAVVLAAPSSPKRFSDTSKLLDYGFANYQFSKIVEKDAVFGEVDIEKGTTEKVTAVAQRAYWHLSKKDAPAIETKIELKQSLIAPVAQGDKLGKVDVLSDGQILASVDLVAAHTVEKLTYWNMFAKTFCAWLQNMC